MSDPDRISEPLLAALLGATPHGLLVCDADGDVLLTNARAAAWLADADGAAIRTEHPAADVLDPVLLSEAIEQVQAQVDEGHAQPRADFAITTADDARLRVKITPIFETDGMPQRFLLQLTRSTAWDALAQTPDRIIQDLTEGIRSPLASMRAAAETMVSYPEMDAAVAAQFKQIILDQAVQLSEHLDATLQSYSQHIKAHWALETMSAADLLDVLQRRLEAEHGVAVSVDGLGAPLTLRVDTYSLAEGFAFLTGLVLNAVRCEAFTLRLRVQGRFAALDLLWEGRTIRLERLRKWEARSLPLAANIVTLTLREVVERHGGEMWTQADDGHAYVRLLIPVA